MNVHHKCQDKVANLCGINQKLLAEALTQVSQVSHRESTPYVSSGSSLQKSYKRNWQTYKRVSVTHFVLFVHLFINQCSPLPTECSI